MEFSYTIRQNRTVLVSVAADGHNQIRLVEHLIGHNGRFLSGYIDAHFRHRSNRPGILPVSLDAGRASVNILSPQFACKSFSHL